MNKEELPLRFSIVCGGYYIGTADRVWWTLHDEHALDFGTWEAAEAYLVDNGLVPHADKRPPGYDSDWLIEALPPLEGGTQVLYGGPRGGSMKSSEPNKND